MVYLAIFGFCAFFVAYWAIATAAARIANGWRVKFLEAVMRQDAAFFDGQEQGALSAQLADGAIDIQTAEKKYVPKGGQRRLWGYSRKEWPLMAIGGVASAIKGTIMPGIAIFFSEMIATWYESDTDKMMQDANVWSYGLYAGGFLMLATEFGQKAIFETVGERLTTRLRSDLFRSLLRQDISYHEDEANTVSALSTRLSTDVKYVRLVTGQAMAGNIELTSALITGLVISFRASWEMCLVMFAMVPLLGIAEFLQWKAIQGSTGEIRGEMAKSTEKLNETVSGIREVQAFALESKVQDEIKQRITETITKASDKEAVAKGVMMGLIQAVQFGVYALAFYIGGKFISSGRIGFDDFFIDIAEDFSNPRDHAAFARCSPRHRTRLSRAHSRHARVGSVVWRR